MRTTSLSVRASVPFLDLRHVHVGLKSELLAEIADLIDANAFTNGPQVAEFERAFAEYCGAEHTVGLASGLDALRLALIAAGAEAGDEVVVPANTFVATLEAVTQSGCRPVVVDVSLRDYNLDVEALRATLGARTRFVMPVHLYGQLADMRSVTAIATQSDAIVLEDACQAHGAERDGIRAGTAGLAAAFSFYPGKNLGAFGDAGAAVTNDASLAASIRALREHGQIEKYRHDVEGWTARLDTIQAIVLLHKLQLLDQWNEQRRGAAARYGQLLEGIGDITLPPVAPGSSPVWHLFVIRTGSRDALAAFLREQGVGVGLHYPQPVHLAPAYAHLGYRAGQFPVAEALAGELLSLPMFPGISEEQLETVAAAVSEFFARGR